jgi:hypothetical protein
MIRSLCAMTQAEWSTKLTELGGELESALAAKDANRSRRVFRRCRSQATYSFNQVDRGLLKVCEELQLAGEQLAGVLRILQP